MRKVVTLIAIVAVLACLPARAYADPIRVTSGVFDLDMEGDVLLFFGADFSLTHSGPIPGVGDPNVFLSIPKTFTSPSCDRPDARCAPGETVNLSFQTPGEQFLGVGSATVGGASYSDVTFRGSLDFRAEDAVLPLGIPGDFYNASSTFVFNGTIRGLDSGGAELFTMGLFGNGRTFVPFFRERDTYFAEDSGPTFVFDQTEPTPEPGTMILFGIGAAALARRARARRQEP